MPVSLATDCMLVNGCESDAVPPGDRGFLYGEGVFETIAVSDARPLNLDRHLARLTRGCERLSLPGPDLRGIAAEARRLAAGRERSVLRIVVTGGEGDRGYAPPRNRSANRYLMVFPWPGGVQRFDETGIAVRLCATRLSINPRLAGIKHLNRLEQVLAGAELDANHSEGIVLDHDGNVIEGISANLLLISHGRLLTPDLSRCGIEGIMRELVLEAAGRLGLPTEVRTVSIEEMMKAEALFLTNAVHGIRRIERVGQRRFTDHPRIRALRAAVQRIETRESVSTIGGSETMNRTGRGETR